MYGVEHHIVEISGDVTDAGRTDERQTSEDRATQPMDAEWLSFAKCISEMYSRNVTRRCISVFF